MSRYNPCGMVVDIGQSAYTTTARLYPDSDQEFKIRWYEALPDALPLPFPSAINNLVFARDREDWLPTAVGEIFGSQYTQQRPGQKPLALGQSYCGTEADFGGRGSIDTTSPPVVYRADGLPMCCGEQFEGNGGLGLGGGSSTPSFEQVLVQVVSSTGTPPVHTCIRMTRDASNNVVMYSPTTTYSQVLNPDACEWPAGARVLMYPIADWPGWYWGEPVLQFEGTSTLNLSQDSATDVVTGDVITQLSVTSDSDGVRLVGDSTPPADRYYGTPSAGTSRGYQDFAAAVQAAAGNPTVINAWLAQLFVDAPNFGIAIIPLGGGVFFAGVDLTVDHTTTETLTTTATLGVTDAAVLQVAQTRQTFSNDFNVAGMLIDRTAAAPVSTDSSVNLDGSTTINVVGVAATSTVTFSAITEDSITSDAGGLKLVGDQATPGDGYVYGTSNLGIKGWYPSDQTWLSNVAGVLSHIGPNSTGHTTVLLPSVIVFDARGHVVSATPGATPVTSISTTNGSGGPLAGAVTFAGGTNVTLATVGSTITINSTGGGIVGPAPTSAPTLTATPGNTQVSLSWTTVSGATSYTLSRGGTTIFTGSGTSFTDTGLTNGTLYSYLVSGVNNNAAGPAGAASATPVAPVTTGTSSSSGTTGSMGVTLPTNANGDTLCMFIWNDSGNSLASVTPAGWTLRATQFTGTTNTCGNLFVRTSTGGLGTVTISSIAQAHWRAIVGNYGAVAWESSTGQASGGSSTSIVCPSVTPTAGAHGLTSFYFADNAATGTASVAAGQTSTVNGGIAIGTETVTGTSPTGTRTGGISPAAWSGGISTLTH